MALSKETLKDHLKQQSEQNASKDRFVGRVVVVIVIVMGIGLGLEVYFLLIAPFVATLWDLFFGPSTDDILKGNVPKGYRINKLP